MIRGDRLRRWASDIVMFTSCQRNAPQTLSPQEERLDQLQEVHQPRPEEGRVRGSREQDSSDEETTGQSQSKSISPLPKGLVSRLRRGLRGGSTCSNTPLNTPSPRRRRRANTSATIKEVSMGNSTNGKQAKEAEKNDNWATNTANTAPMSKEAFEAPDSSNVVMESEEALSTPSFHSANLTSRLSPLVAHVELRRGLHLAARDSCGTSDPYVKFFVNDKLVYKSRTCYKDLNPVWDEKFVVELDNDDNNSDEDNTCTLDVKVFDYDWAFRDDFIGASSMNLSSLAPNIWHRLTLELLDANAPIDEHLGHLEIVVFVEPLINTSANRRLSTHSAHSFSTLNSTSEPRNKGITRNSPWLAVVHVLLVEARNLSVQNTEGTTYCKFRLGNERYKSRPIYQSLNPRWVDQFDLYLFNESQAQLEISVCDKERKGEPLGKCNLDVSQIQQEKTHDLTLSLGEDCGTLRILVTVTGLTVFERTEDLEEDVEEKEGEDAPQHLDGNDTYKGLKSSGVQWWPLYPSIPYDPETPVKPRAKPGSPQCVLGHLEVTLFCAQGLYAADLGGKSDPFAVIELDNERRQTHTEYKTICPEWRRTFSFDVKDIHSDLVVTIFDENRHHSYEFLGKMVLPLLNVVSGQKTWFGLKDKRLRGTAKGTEPKLLIRAKLNWSPYLAGIRTINPKEEKLMQPNDKFKRHIFITNVMRLKSLIMELVWIGNFVDSCFSWHYPLRSFLALVLFVVFVWYFEPYMLPLLLLLLFVRGLVMDPDGRAAREAANIVAELDEDEAHSDDKESRKSIKAKLQAVQEVSATVQNAIGFAASLGESVKNTFNFSVPFLSYFAILILALATVLLYMVSLRVVILVWGINKFSKKLINPLYVDNNELIDFLSRVPSDERLLDYRPIKVSGNPVENAAEKEKKKVKS